jgi:hypothetical protein
MRLKKAARTGSRVGTDVCLGLSIHGIKRRAICNHQPSQAASRAPMGHVHFFEARRAVPVVRQADRPL